MPKAHAPCYRCALMRMRLHYFSGFNLTLESRSQVSTNQRDVSWLSAPLPLAPLSVPFYLSIPSASAAAIIILIAVDVTNEEREANARGEDIYADWRQFDCSVMVRKYLKMQGVHGGLCTNYTVDKTVMENAKFMSFTKVMERASDDDVLRCCDHARSRLPPAPPCLSKSRKRQSTPLPSPFHPRRRSRSALAPPRLFRCECCKMSSTESTPHSITHTHMRGVKRCLYSISDKFWLSCEKACM